MNKTISRYINRNILYPQLIVDAPDESLGIVVVIPCYDEPDVGASVLAIANCQPPQCNVEVIVSINAGVNSPAEAKKRNEQSKIALLKLQAQMPDWLKVHTIVHNDLPDKKAGVGLGRKIGMDEAVRRLVSLNKENGIIVCFDADSSCDSNYLFALESHFAEEQVGSASIYYEHPTDDTEYPEAIYKSIVQYELHLRYFIRMQKRLQLPYAYHTVGSSMACTVLAYCAVGGMNQRKAGEDFYFIHKLVKYGKHSELNTTRVIPSPRISDRVPFGTGKAIGTMQNNNENYYRTYHPQSFKELNLLVDTLPGVYKKRSFDEGLSDELKDFLESINANVELDRILNNTSDYPSFVKKFWHWFDAFVLMKYLHFVRDKKNEDILVLEAINLVENRAFSSAREALIYYREMDVIP